MSGKISVAINCDSRQGSNEQSSTQDIMLKGTRSFDFLWEGVLNKMKFFEGYDYEIILFVDKHLDIPTELYEKWNTLENLTICISKHREYLDDYSYYPKWNDHNFLQALYLARGQYIVHLDGDMNLFRQDECKIVDEMISLLDRYSYISYPSPWSPNPDCGDWDYWWASTRFFLCERKTLDFTEIEKCLRDSGYLYGVYGQKKRACPWLEHVLGIIAGNGNVFYPPLDLDNYAIFAWSRYIRGTLEKLNNMCYDDVRQFILDRGGIMYPNDVSC